MTAHDIAVAVRWLTQQAQAVAASRVDLERDRRARQARIARQARDTRGRWCRRADDPMDPARPHDPTGGRR